MNRLIIICILVSGTLQWMGSFIGAILPLWFLMLVLALIGLVKKNKKSWLLSSLLLVLLLNPLISHQKDIRFSAGVIMAVVAMIIWTKGQRYLRIQRKEAQDYHGTLLSFTTDELASLIAKNNQVLLNREEMELLAELTAERESEIRDIRIVRSVTMLASICVAIFFYYNGISGRGLISLLVVVAFAILTYLLYIAYLNSKKEYEYEHEQVMEEAKGRANQLITSRNREVYQ